jgi:alpha-tubulin suppressor-like RCC1 family protein
MNTESLLTTLHAKIDSANTAFELLEVAKVIQFLNLRQVNTVDSYFNLLNVGPGYDGELYYVESDGKYYYRFGSAWIEITKSALGEQITWAWGDGSNGRLGNNSTIGSKKPVSVVGGFTDWIQVAAGRDHSLGVRANGTAWAWGLNTNGRLGDNTTTVRSSPVSVVGGFTDWIQVSGGTIHSLGLRANGTAWGWGTNTDSQLGDGTITTRSSPVSVVGGYTDWIQVAAGGSHSLGLRANGTAWGWGFNSNGQLGTNDTSQRTSPVSVVGGFTDWIQVAGGTSHSLGLRANGTAWAWGLNTSSQLGTNNTTTRSSPVSVVGGFTDWIQVAAGGSHSLGLRANGTAWAWGSNASGRLGDNTLTSRSSPVSVVGGFTDWIQVAGGIEHSLGLRANGTAWAWGGNEDGELGDDTNTSRLSPVSVVTVVDGYTWIQVAGGGGYSLGVRSQS